MAKSSAKKVLEEPPLCLPINEYFTIVNDLQQWSCNDSNNKIFCLRARLSEFCSNGYGVSSCTKWILSIVSSLQVFFFWESRLVIYSQLCFSSYLGDWWFCFVRHSDGGAKELIWDDFSTVFRSFLTRNINCPNSHRIFYRTFDFDERIDSN